MRIDVGDSSSVSKITERMEFLEADERKKLLRAARKAQARVLTLYGAEAAAKLAADFRMEKKTVREIRLFRNAKRARVWIGGNAMNASRYGNAQTPQGAYVARFGIVPGAFIVRASGADLIFAPSTAPLPGWAAFSGKPWRSGARELRKVAVSSPENFRARYAPNEADVRAKFEAEFLKNLEK